MKEEIRGRLQINAGLTLDTLHGFLREEVTKSGFQKVVFGLSGGIDSALVAYLAAGVLQKERVHAVMMPYETSSKASLDDAQKVVDDLNIPYSIVPITAPVQAYFENVDNILANTATPLRRGNRMARERMCTLFDFSAYLGALVLGTSNKTELLLGYGTQFGDMASALNPIGDLYKCQIRQLSEAVGVPKSILEKAPSADLWEDQTDERELGFTYDDADEILYQLVDMRLTVDEVVEQGYRRELAEILVRRVMRNQYKRKPPVIAKVSGRTIGIDFRYLRDWGN
jgi:NAD+ synthase